MILNIILVLNGLYIFYILLDVPIMYDRQNIVIDFLWLLALTLLLLLLGDEIMSAEGSVSLC